MRKGKGNVWFDISKFALNVVLMFTLTAIRSVHICSHNICMKQRPFFDVEVTSGEVTNERFGRIYCNHTEILIRGDGKLCPVQLWREIWGRISRFVRTFVMVCTGFIRLRLRTGPLYPPIKVKLDSPMNLMWFRPILASRELAKELCLSFSAVAKRLTVMNSVKKWSFKITHISHNTALRLSIFENEIHQLMECRCKNFLQVFLMSSQSLLLVRLSFDSLSRGWATRLARHLTTYWWDTFKSPNNSAIYCYTMWGRWFADNPNKTALCRLSTLRVKKSTSHSGIYLFFLFFILLSNGRNGHEGQW